MMKFLIIPLSSSLRSKAKHLLFLLLFCFAPKYITAQVALSFADSTEFHTPPWQGDLEAFCFSNGALQRNNEKISKDKKTIYCLHNTRYSSSMQWQGELQFSLGTSYKDQWTLLLYPYEKTINKEGKEEIAYVALELDDSGCVNLIYCFVSGFTEGKLEKRTTRTIVVSSYRNAFAKKRTHSLQWKVVLENGSKWSLYLSNPTFWNREMRWIGEGFSDVPEKAIENAHWGIVLNQNNQAKPLFALQKMEYKAFGGEEEEEEDPNENPNEKPNEEAPRELAKPLLSEILFHPFLGGAEYIELYNPSDEVIDLSHYAIAKRTEGRLGRLYPIEGENLQFPPKSYRVLTPWKGGIINHYSVDESAFVEMEKFPALPNTAGEILLLEKESKEIVEELIYSLKGVKNSASYKGCALERISFERPSTEMDNWAFATEKQGYGSPTKENHNRSTIPCTTLLTAKDINTPRLAAEYILQHLSSKELRLSARLYSVRGDCLVYWDKEQAIRLCQALTNPDSKLFSSLAQRRIILAFECQKNRKSRKHCFAFLIQLPP